MNRLRPETLQMLDGRYEEMRLRYWENRATAEKLIHDVERYTPVVSACFAAARAALQCALEDGVITLDEHVWLAEAHFAFDSLCVDDYSECAVGFDAEISHPLGASASQEDVEAYLAAARLARDDIKGRTWEMTAFYEWAVMSYDSREGPYRIVTAAATRWVRFRRGLGRRSAVLLECYFRIMHTFVEDVGFGAPEIPNQLDRALRGSASDLYATGDEAEEWP